jgi:hypothetical protein
MENRLVDAALATLNPVRPVKVAVSFVSGSPSLARVIPDAVTVYDVTDCTEVVIVTVLPVSEGVPLRVRPGTS